MTAFYALQTWSDSNGSFTKGTTYDLEESVGNVYVQQGRMQLAEVPTHYGTEKSVFGTYDDDGNLTSLFNKDGSFSPSFLNQDQLNDGATGIVAQKSDNTFISYKANDVTPPVGAIVSATDGAGNLTGTYYWNTVFLLSDGTKTEPWAGNPVEVVFSSNKAALSGIPVSTNPKVVGREIYRTKSSGADVKDYYYAFTINDNTTTTASDNLADASLGAPINWLGTDRGLWSIDGAVLGRSNGQSMALGEGSNAGYASVHMGFESGKSTTTGRRNNGFGVYALTTLTTGYQDCGFGTHAGQSVTTAWGCSFFGDYSGYSVTTAEENTAVGNNALGSLTQAPGRRNTSVGANSMASINGAWTAGSSLGYAAGKYVDASYQIHFDAGIDRVNATGMKNDALIFGQAVPANTPAQFLNVNASVRLGTIGLTVATLTTALPASSANIGRRAYVNDASVAYTGANIGSTVAGGGANVVPVFCNGTNWVIG